MPAHTIDVSDELIQFLHRAPVGLAQTTLDGDVEMINPMTATLLMPLSRDGNLDNLFAVLEDAAPQLRPMVAAFDSPSGVVCDALRIVIEGRAMGHAAPQVLSFSLMKLDEARLMAVLIDVTLEVRREQDGLARHLSAAARIDNLTQMPNRAGVLEQLQQTIEHAAARADHEFAVLFINCDRFSQINDRLGHAVGDQLLGLMAERLRAALRSHDRVSGTMSAEHIAARIGGDEFAVVLDILHGPDDVHAVAQRLIDVMAKPYSIGPEQVHCGVSIGVALRAQATGDADAMLQVARTALVEAKRAGGACYVIFEPSMQDRAVRRSSIEAELRCALDEAQLFVMYQPVVGLQDPGGLDVFGGVEALVRWRHPTRGIVPPLEFIGVAEECGLIGAIGDFVLDTACRQFVLWQQTLGPRAPRKLAVNVSRSQLGQVGWVSTVQDIIQSTGMPVAQLQLEVTESLAAQGESVQTRLHALKALGLTLALDDFGTGYSSLSSLHLLPVDTVKIDRSFVSQVDTSHHHRVLVEATIRVATSLGMSTVAEGIETESQATAVRALGCVNGQGYLFSKPLLANDVEAWLNRAPLCVSGPVDIGPAEAAPDVGRTLHSGFESPPLVFTCNELQALAAAVRLGLPLALPRLGAALAGHAEEALSKILSVLPAAMRAAAESLAIFAPPVGPDTPLRQRFEALRAATEARQTLQLVYVDLQGLRTEQAVRPLACFHDASVWTLAVWSEMPQGFRYFRVDHIAELHLLDSHFQDEPGKTLADLVRQTETAAAERDSSIDA